MAEPEDGYWNPARVHPAVERLAVAAQVAGMSQEQIVTELAALRATIAEQAATIASLRDRERTIREAVNAYLSEQITSKRKLTDAMLAHLPELHGGDSDY